MSSALELEEYWVDRVLFDERDDQVREASSADLQWEPALDWAVYRAADSEEARYLVNLKVTLPKESPVSRAVIELSGVFLLHNEDGEAPDTLLNLNGPSILYGVARGLTGTITALMPSGKLTLPSVNFIDLAARRARRKRQQRRTSTSA